MSRDIDVLVLGGAGVDTIVHVPQLPLPYADSYMIEQGIRTRAGQTGDFVALGLDALGLRVHHLDMLGDDPEGDLVRALHTEKDIAFTAIPHPAGTKRAVNLVGPDGRRLSLYDVSRTQGEDRFPEDTVRTLAGASRHVHVTITQPCADALPLLRESGATLSTDLHDWDGENPYHAPFAHAADVVFLSATALGDPERTMRRIADRGRAEVVVATAGAKGAYLLADDELTHIPPATPPARSSTPTARATPSPRPSSTAGSTAKPPPQRPLRHPRRCPRLHSPINRNDPTNPRGPPDKASGNP